MLAGDSGYGLSPRMRGTVGERGVITIHCRFIPADAGNGAPSAISRSLTAVYPRGCGERTATPCRYSFARGLSPRMRGTGHPLTAKAIHDRVIPADAGNGVAICRPVSAQPAYPRGCGERLEHGGFAKASRGLSPRMRGTDIRQKRQLRIFRFIPADAGNGPAQMR